MREKDIIKKIELLQKIKPNDEWVISLRSKLAFRMEMERKKDLLNKDIFVLKELFSFWKNYKTNRTYATYRFALSLGIILSILGGGGLTAFASLRSLPGSGLYPLKIALERAHVLAATSEEAKVKLRSEMAGRRLEELKTVVDIVEPAEQKKERVDQVMDNIQEQLVTASNQLPKVGEKMEPGKAIAAARAVSEKADQVEKTLAQVKDFLPNNVGDKLAQTAVTADKAGTQALEVIVDNQDQSDSAGKKEVLAKIGEKIATAKAEIKIMGERARQATSTAAGKLGIMAVLVKDQSDKAQELLSQASESLNEENASEALRTVKVAKEIIKMAENIADNDDRQGLFDGNGETAENATTTGKDLDNASSSGLMIKNKGN